MSGKELPWLPDFKIAFTFTGEYRERIVRPACEELLKYGYREDDIFFDEWHPEIFNGVNADSIFREIYHDVSQCVVVLLSPNYSDKLWTGNLEWPTVRALINEGNHRKICLLRVDDVALNKIDGLYSTRDVARPVDKMTPAEIARFIHRWYCIHVLKQSPDAGSAKKEQTHEPAASPKKEAVSLPGAAVSKPTPASEPVAGKVDTRSAREQADIIPENNELILLLNDNALFGSYPQTAEGKRQPIEWQVLKQEEDRTLLISRYALDVKPYNQERTATTWGESALRSWLNGSGKNDFLQTAFTAEERERICTVEVPADQNPYWSTEPGRKTEDKVFLLSIPEVNELLTPDAARRCAPTDYVKRQNLLYTDNDFIANGRPACWWWLRSPGSNSDSAACVHRSGAVDVLGNRVNFEIGVRPALWINL